MYEVSMRETDALTRRRTVYSPFDQNGRTFDAHPWSYADDGNQQTQTIGCVNTPCLAELPEPSHGSLSGAVPSSTI